MKDLGLVKRLVGNISQINTVPKAGKHSFVYYNDNRYTIAIEDLKTFSNLSDRELPDTRFMDYLKKESNKELAIGLSLQIRNATISFASADGSLFRINEGIGPVPIFKFRTKYPFQSGMWLGTEVDGFYASGKYITGSENDFEGAILDASARIGFEFSEHLDSYLNIRYIGGGAKGQEPDEPGPGDGFTDNWLHTMSISLGFYAK